MLGILPTRKQTEAIASKTAHVDTVEVCVDVGGDASTIDGPFPDNGSIDFDFGSILHVPSTASGGTVGSF